MLSNPIFSIGFIDEGSSIFDEYEEYQKAEYCKKHCIQTIITQTFFSFHFILLSCLIIHRILIIFLYNTNFCHFYLPHSHLIDSIITATVQHPHCYYLPDNYYLPHYNLHSLNSATGFCMSLYVIIFMAKHLTEYHLQKKARTSRSGLFLSYIFCFLWKSIQQYWLKHGDSPYQPERFLNVRHEAVAH